MSDGVSEFGTKAMLWATRLGRDPADYAGQPVPPPPPPRKASDAKMARLMKTYEEEILPMLKKAGLA